MRTDIVSKGSIWKVVGGALLLTLNGCVSSNRPQPMSEVQGKTTYPVHIYSKPYGTSDYQESLDVQECDTRSGTAPTPQTNDQMFLDCMGDRGYRLKIYRSGYVLSNLNQPSPPLPTPAPAAPVPFIPPSPAQNDAPGDSPSFQITRQEAYADAKTVIEAYGRAKATCKGDKNCYVRNGASAAIKVALNTACSHQAAIYGLLESEGHVRLAPDFLEAAQVVCR